MKRFEVPGYNAPLVTRKDLFEETDRLLRPLLPLFSQGDTRIHMGNMSSGAPDAVSEIEGFSRILWALSAMKELTVDDPLWVKIRQGLVNGTNPDHPNYFGDLGDKEQRIVETAAIGYAFVLRPDCIYDPLSTEEQERLVTWLDGVNEKEAHPCNWKFFRVMVNIGFKALGLPYNKAAMEAHLEDIETYYVGDGWYKDGEAQGSHAEYYVPFAMHYYGLFYAMTMEDVDPQRAAIYKQRAKAFADDFIYWFSSDGSALPYGRSLTYRFAQVGFFSMMVVAGVECQWSLGQIKGIIMRHLRWWKEQPYLDSEGRMTMGYAYPNPFMTEEYNAPGSVYWSLKSMVILSLDESHAFWQAEEEAMPVLEERHRQAVPNFIVTRDKDSKHVLAYNGGNYHTNGHTHVECKYEKFVYSTYFGFSVPRSHRDLRFGAFDSTLAVSEDGTYYRHKDKSIVIEVLDDEIITLWKPYEDVTIRTRLLVDHPWHVRIHDIVSARHLQVAEGGYALGIEGDGKLKEIHTKETHQVNYEGLVYSPVDYSGIRSVKGFMGGMLLSAISNTNLMNPKTIIPTLQASIEPGTHQLVSLVYGDCHGVDTIEEPTALIRRLEEALKES